MKMMFTKRLLNSTSCEPGLILQKYNFLKRHIVLSIVDFHRQIFVHNVCAPRVERSRDMNYSPAGCINDL